jgi:enterochelin esterase-like enzyme
MRTVEAFTLPEDRTGIFTPVMLAHQKNNAGNSIIHDYMLRYYAEPKDFASFLYASQVLQAEGIKTGAEHLRRNRPRTMGSIYWQLNDCWPVASWSSLDYEGRWKALQYYARRFYNDLLVSPHEENGSAAVYVISDRTTPTSANLRVRLMTFEGKVLSEKSQAIEVPALSSQVYLQWPLDELARTQGYDPQKTFVVTELTVGEKPVSCNLLFFAAPKDLALPAPQIASALTQAGDSFRLRLSSPVLARSVSVSLGNVDAKLSDDYFDLLPGETVEVEVTSSASLEQLRSGLEIVSLADAFQSATAGAPGLAQPPRPSPPPAPQFPPPLISPEVQSDHRVTFRFRDPNAKEVTLAREGTESPLPMQRDEKGVWSVTTDPLEPDFYGYSFLADGVSLIDPSNPLMKPNLLSTQSEVHVPGPASLPWELANVPHGVIHHHFYRSEAVGDDRDYYVYTPPGYDPAAQRLYPALYLLHGFSDDASAWTAVGRAHVILDNLIAQGKAQPMIVVMPLGYGAPEILSYGFSALDNDSRRRRNIDKFRDALLAEVIPRVEKAYRVAADRNSRAIAGLSMGGAESLSTGLNALDRFAWIGAFSSGRLGEDFNAGFPALDAKANSKLRLLWIACGTDDRLIAPNRKFREWLASKGVQHTDIETPGAHTWMVWRRNLAAFVPLLFR